jgi:nitroimidazol reductase NimA-like FMN-containing flavoprotein (pyridoxamine 5'-phosphate oxidase superfamily)
MEQNPGQPYGVPTFTGYKNSQPYCHVSPIEFEDWLGDVPNIEKKELEDWDRWIKLEEGEE